MHQNRESLPRAVSVRNRAQIRPRKHGLSKILSHGEERKAPQLSELLRQRQEHELSVTGATTALRASRAPGARQSAFGHPTSKRGHETENLPGHVALTKGELYPMGSAEAPKKEKEDL